MSQKKSKNDNVVFVNGPDEAKQHNAELIRKSKRKNRYIVVVLIAIVAISVVIIYSLLNREYKGYKVLESNETTYENTANYTQFAGNLLKYTPDGVSYINKNGDAVWMAGLGMKMPIVVTKGNYAVIADMNGNAVSVFSNEGQISTHTMPYTICDVEVGNQGAFAVVLESEETNYINLYNKNGEIIYEIQTTINKSGYPLDITISDDGKKLITSYIVLNGSEARINLAAYNFGDVGQNANADRMVGGYMFDEIIPKVEFIDNDTFVAFGTRTISIYSMKEKPSLKAKIGLEQDVRSVFYGDDYIGIIQDDINENSEHLYVMTVYSDSGKEEFTEYIDFQYNNIYAAKNEIIITGNSSCKIVRANGNVKFAGDLSGNIVNMVPSGKNLEYIVVYEDSSEVIKLRIDDNTGDTPKKTETEK